jgi:SAM-dependent methyltransferase
MYDARQYRTLEVGPGYEAWSPHYDQKMDGRMDLALLERLGTVPWQEFRTVADLGCGTGRLGVWLHQHGVTHIHGVDCCPAMLRYAAEKQVYERLEIADITRCPFDGQEYDHVITGLAACHVPELRALYAESARLLRPGAIFVLLDYHPFFLLQGIPTHFKSADGEQIAIRNFVHLFSDHVSAGRAVGWELLELQERLVDAEWVTARPEMRRHEGQPVSFAAVWRVVEKVDCEGTSRAEMEAR